MTLDELKHEGLARIADATSVDELRKVETDLWGKKSQLALLQRQLGGLDPDERRARGAEINAVRELLADKAAERRSALADAERRAQLESDRLALTQVVDPPRPR